MQNPRLLLRRSSAGDLWSREERLCLSLLRRSPSQIAVLAVHAFLLRRDLVSNLPLLTLILSASSDSRYSRRIFHHLRRRDSRICNTFIQTLARSRKNGICCTCISLYRDLLRNPPVGFPDNYTFPFLLKSCAESEFYREGIQLHGQIVKLGFDFDVFTSTGLVDMHVKSGNLGYALKVFDEMPHRSPASWTSIIIGHAKLGNVEAAVELFRCMPEKDTAAFNALIDVFVKLGDVGSAKKVFDEMREKNVVSWSSMLFGYCKVGDMEAARELFDEMDERNLYSWNTMINGYSQNGQPHQAIELFRQLQSAFCPYNPDDVTIISIIPAIADIGAVELGRWIHNYARRRGLESLTNVSTSLIDMYAKCGDIQEAKNIFSRTSNKTTATWNAIINGLAVNGFAKEALDVFNEMLKNEVRPNEVTVIGVLSACSHGGLVEEGRKWFGEMKVYGVDKRVEHYGCMVDLLGRGGYLDEAERLINEMPFTANGIILSSLLFACGNHGDVDRAEKIMGKATKLEPISPRNYVTLRNLYAWKKRWDDVDRTKGVLRELGGKKEAGCSVVEIENRVWEFVSGDQDHLHWVGISYILECLQIHMKGSRDKEAVELRAGGCLDDDYVYSKTSTD